MPFAQTSNWIKNTVTTPWQNRVAEVVAIAVTILLAFAIEAWWQEQQERERETEILLDLSKEIKNSLNVAEEGEMAWLRLHIETRNSVATLLEHMYGAELKFVNQNGLELLDSNSLVEFERRIRSSKVVGEVVVPVHLVTMISRTSTWGPKIGTLDLLINSGALLDLENEKLRSHLTALPALLDDMVDEENELRRIVDEVVLPELARLEVPGEVYRITYPHWLKETLRADGVELLAESDVRLKITPQLEQAVSLLFTQLHQQHGEMVVLTNEFRHIVDLIEAD